MPEFWAEEAVAPFAWTSCRLRAMALSDAPGARPSFTLPAQSWAIAAAEAGSLPIRCPVPACGSIWEEDLSPLLDGAAAAKIAAAQRLKDELQARTCSERLLSPRGVEELKRLGIRQCPRCLIFIQKQADGLLTGCDKMTCRCGPPAQCASCDGSQM
ncbi:UBC6 [Symbiodinium natans]|uniref:UBC6 protein n=1 Tax=Symbiodinium natans TaxID=878477 RepID=A0A812N9V4_9DINO|nr:UBC6 [Symbiodinium natans]